MLEAVLDAQPAWADHARPDPSLAFEAAARAGLDMARALNDIARADNGAALQQDVEDLRALQITRTPTFYVNGRPLTSFGPVPLAALVAEEIAKARD